MRTIESITFNAKVGNLTLSNLSLEITPNQGYTDNDLAEGAWFGTHIGKDYYDVHILANRMTKHIDMDAKLLRRTKKGKWIEDSHQPNITITNVKVKYCNGLN